MKEGNKRMNVKNSDLTNCQFIATELITQFNAMIKEANNIVDNDDLLKQASIIAEKIINITLRTYEETHNKYTEVRGNRIKEIDEICWNTLNKYIEKYIGNNKKDISILDVGTGNGRDLIHGQRLGYNTIGIDNCNGFIELLSIYASKGLIKKDSYMRCDMRALKFPDRSFDVVRHNATLLHLPLIGKKYTVDLALSEAHRVLKENGLLHIFVKTGSTLEILDTNENLGGRVFQFFTHEKLSDVVTRNNFTILHSSDEVEIREKNKIDWILLIAQKHTLLR